MVGESGQLNSDTHGGGVDTRVPKNGPTRGMQHTQAKKPTEPRKQDGADWQSRPALAFAVRGLFIVLPILSGWLAVRTTATIFWRPHGAIGWVLWVIQAIVVALVGSAVVQRVLRRFTPITSLLNMTLVFPDRAPSRYSIALKAGTVGKLREQIVLSDDPQEAAEQALALVAALGRHERLTRGHTERVRAYADLIGLELGLSEDERHKLRWGVLLHDVGKLGVPADILNKPGRPTEEEWNILKQHPAIGRKMLEPLEEWLGPWGLAAAEHHERWDGGGYPLGLKGEEISLAGRIAAVADAYDVITSKRSYKDAKGGDSARRELVRCSGDQFDPMVVRAFLRLSLKESHKTGWLGWLLEIPTLVRLVLSAGGAATAPAAAAAAITAAAVTGAVVPDPSPPDAVAFAEETATTIVTETTIVPTTPATSVETSPPAAPTTIVPATVAPTTTAPASTTTSETTTTSTTPATTAVPQTTVAPTTTISDRQIGGVNAAVSTTMPPTSVAPIPLPLLQSDVAVIQAGQDQRAFVLNNDQSGGAGFDLATLRIMSAEPGALDLYVRDDHIVYETDPAQIGDYAVIYEICNDQGGCAQATLMVTAYQV